MQCLEFRDGDLGMSKFFGGQDRRKLKDLAADRKDEINKQSIISFQPDLY